MKNFKYNALTLAIATAGFLSTHSYAQQTDRSATTAIAAEDSIEVIDVKGIRASLIKAQAVKMDSGSIVEAITAEDIGKLPDPSIAETLARLPGLAARRVDGRASAISIRGLNEDFSTTTFNGREQVSLNDSRGVDFYLYPAEIMSGVVVYKSPQSILTSQGIAGVVDLQSIKPLSHNEQTVQIGGLYEKNSLGKLNPDAKEDGHRLSGTYIDQFADDTFGIAISVNSMSSPNQEERWNAWGGTEWPSDADGNIILGGAKPYVRSSTQKRDTVMVVGQYQPNSKLEMTADVLYIDYADESILRGIEIPSVWGGDVASVESVTVEDGFVTDGIIHGVRSVMRNDYSLGEADFLALGFNLEYALTDSTKVEFDLSRSDVERDSWLMESYAGTGRGDGVGAADDIGFSMNKGNYGVTFDPMHDYSDPTLYQMGGALSWGGGNTLYAAADDQDGFISTVDLNDTLTTAKLEIRQVVDSFVTQVTGGVYYSDRTKSKIDSGTFLTLPSYPNMQQVPEEYRLAPVSLDFIGMGNMLAYDAFRFYQDGNYTETKEDLTATFRATNSWSVSEEVFTGYVQADFEGQLADDIYLTGNAGMQVVRTEQSSDGNAATNDSAGLVVITPVHDGDSYTEYLPALNLSLNLYEHHYLRFAAAKTLSRSRMDRMNASLSYGFNEVLNTTDATIEVSPWSANGGNPKLRPQIANTYDLSYEYYFAEDGYIAFATFYKDLKSWQISSRTNYDFSQITPPNNQVALFNQGYYWQWQNAEGGSLSGQEITLSLPGRIISDYLDGFGVVASASFVDSSVQVDGNEANIPGLSDSVYNLTAFYENKGWQLRASIRKRDDFPAELGYNADPVVIAGSEVIDAQIGYDFSESDFTSLHGLSVSLQVYNLTNEPFTAFASGDPRLVRDYQVYGTNYLAAASYRF